MNLEDYGTPPTPAEAFTAYRHGGITQDEMRRLASEYERHAQRERQTKRRTTADDWIRQVGK